MSRLALSETVMIASARRAATSTSGRFSSTRRGGWYFGNIVRLMSWIVTTVGTGHRQRHHAVREVRDVDAQTAKQPRRDRLHPDDPRNPRRRHDHPNLWRQRTRRVERTIRDDDDFVVPALSGQMVEQVLGVVPDAGPCRTKRRAIKRDAHAPPPSNSRPR